MAVPQTPQNRAILRVLLNDPIPPGGTDADARFSDAQLDALLAVSSSMSAAAALGWLQTASRFVDPNQLVRGQIGTESLQFPDPADLRRWALEAYEWFEAKGNPSRILSIELPVFWGISGPYDAEWGPYGNLVRRWLDWDASRLGGTVDRIPSSLGWPGMHGGTG